MAKVKKEITHSVTLNKKEMDDLFRKEFSLEGEIHYSVEETGDYDRGTGQISGMDIWSVVKE